VFSQAGDELQVTTTSDDTTVRILDVETGNPVGFPLEARGPPDTVDSRDVGASPFPSLPLQEQSNRIHPASSSAPALASPANSFWKRFPMLNKSAASLKSLKRWKFPRIGNIM
jgi:hypothetical protein